ncbi:hypothetical protein NKH18_04135 [Streptomyces sp. M10(2022)]
MEPGPQAHSSSVPATDGGDDGVGRLTRTRRTADPGLLHATGGHQAPDGTEIPDRAGVPGGAEIPGAPQSIEDLQDPEGPEGADALKDLGAPREPEDLGDHDVVSLTEDGRGLMLVDALATRWGTNTGLTGRLVWADI